MGFRNKLENTFANKTFEIEKHGRTNIFAMV
jgi:hypothetical protein